MLKTNYSVCQTKLQLCRGSALVSAGLYSFTFTEWPRPEWQFQNTLSEFQNTLSQFQNTLSQFQNTFHNFKTLSHLHQMAEWPRVTKTRLTISKHHRLSGLRAGRIISLIIIVVYICNQIRIFEQPDQWSTLDTKLCWYYVLRSSDRLSISSYCVKKMTS